MSGSSTTAEDPRILARKVAEAIEKMNGVIGDLPTLKDRIKAVEGMCEALKGAETSDVKEEIDRLKASHEKLVSKIRLSKGGLYISGAEDEAERFSVLKTIRALKKGGRKSDFEALEAGREFELLKQVEKRYDVQKAQVAGDDALGGAFIPDQVIPDVIQGIYTRSAYMRTADEDGVTRVTVVDGLPLAPVTVPKFNGGMVAEWIGERQRGSETQASTGSITLNPKKLGAWFAISEDMIRSGAYGFEQLVRTDLARACAKKMDWTIAYGTGGDHTPRGIFYTDGVQVYRAEDSAVFSSISAARASALADWDGGELEFVKLSEMMLALEEDDVNVAMGTVIGAPRWFNRLKNLRVSYFSSGAAEGGFLLGAPMLSDERLRDTIGDFGKSTQVPVTNKPGATIGAPTDSTTEKYTDVVYGDLSQVLVARFGGLEITDDQGMGLGHLNDETLVKARLRADVGIRQERALIVCVDAKASD